MDSFAKIVPVVLQIAIMIAIGYAAEKTKYVSNIKSAIGKVVINITLPLLVITKLTETPLSFEKGKLVGIVSLATFIIVFALLFIGSFVSKLFKLSYDAQSIHTVLTGFGNVAFMGYAMITALFGGENLIYAVFYGLINDFVLYTYGIFILGKGNGKGKSELRSLFNPNTISIIIGVIMAILGLKLPSLIHVSFSTVGSSTMPLSMLYIGSTLAGISLNGVFKRYSIYTVVLVKMIVMPIILIFVMRLIPVPLIVKSVIIMQAALPCQTVTPILAEKYGGDTVYAAECIFICTTLSLLTMPFIFFLLQRFLI